MRDVRRPPALHPRCHRLPRPGAGPHPAPARV